MVNLTIDDAKGIPDMIAPMMPDPHARIGVQQQRIRDPHARIGVQQQRIRELIWILNAAINTAKTEAGNQSIDT